MGRSIRQVKWDFTFWLRSIGTDEEYADREESLGVADCTALFW